MYDLLEQNVGILERVRTGIERTPLGSAEVMRTSPLGFSFDTHKACTKTQRKRRLEY